MIVKNNYEECITNLACSIRKYFDLDYKHNTLKYVDELLERKKPKNIVTILFDGMGSRILDRTLSEDDFFIKNRYKEITTVFPATTAAATNSYITGLNPNEHGYLGWYTYVSPIDETIMVFIGINKETGEMSSKYLEARKKYFVNKTITDEINDMGKYKSVMLYPFGDNPYHGLDDMFLRIKRELSGSEKKYIYAYDDEPDHTMHDLGPDDEKVKELIKIRNDKVQEFSQELEDTIIFVIADHGHKVVDSLYLKDYPDIMDLFERTTSIEQRAVSFKIKEGRHQEFETVFNEYFGKWFNLFKASEVIHSNLFGTGDNNSIFEEAVGDYIAIAISDKALLLDGDEELYSQHAGYTDDEIYIPLIIIDRCERKTN